MVTFVYLYLYIIGLSVYKECSCYLYSVSANRLGIYHNLVILLHSFVERSFFIIQNKFFCFWLQNLIVHYKDRNKNSKKKQLTHIIYSLC